MVIEHTFVTTLEAADTLRLASDFLRWWGFEAQVEGGFQLGQPAWNAVELRRGMKNPARAKSLSDLPQQVRLEWDRGRVTLAAAITPRAGAFGTPKSLANTDPLHQQLLMAIAQSLEMLLVHRYPPEQAAQPWQLVEARIQEKATHGRRRSRTIVIVVVCIFAALIALSIWANLQ